MALGYSTIQNSKAARKVADAWVSSRLPAKERQLLRTGLPEWDGRLDVWRVALMHQNSRLHHLGEIHIELSGEIRVAPDTSLVIERLGNVHAAKVEPTTRRKKQISFPPTPNKAILGDCRTVLREFPRDSAQLVFTSPPYFNAKLEYAEYLDYPAYLNVLRDAFDACHEVLAEGRFLVVNVSPVLVRRTTRNTSSKRFPIHFDLHPILDALGFEFIDDIIWRKPEGAGWHLGRGRRFAADRQPLQYKPVTVTEYLLVYRKKTTQLIDWNLKNHPDQDALTRSLILGDYDKTNVWDITPSHHKDHPAVFPDELVRRVIRYYSFEGDVVLDPFAGSGTVGRVASEMNRKFVLIEKRRDYFDTMARSLGSDMLVSPMDVDDLQYLWSAE